MSRKYSPEILELTAHNRLDEFTVYCSIDQIQVIRRYFFKDQAIVRATV